MVLPVSSDRGFDQRPVTRSTGTGSGLGRGPATSVGTGFVGRSAELRRVEDCAKDTELGRPWTIVVTGVSGIGKTSLIRHAVAGLNHFTTLWATADSWESEIPYGVVSQLMSGVPAAYRQDFPTLFGRIDPGLTPWRVGTDLIELLDRMHADRPVVIVLDDAQEADVASLRALAFAKRRLHTNETLLIMAANPTEPMGDLGLDGGTPRDWQRLATSGTEVCELRLSGLTEAEIALLARGYGLSWLASGAADWLSRYTGGHPLYLRTLLAHAEPTDLADGRGVTTLPVSLVEAVLRQVSTLPGASVRLLEVLAVLDGWYPLAVVAEMAEIDDPAEALTPLLAEELVRRGANDPATPVRIRHPLQRDAVYEGIAPRRRRALHVKALAWCQGQAAWAHRVAATDRVDPALADELEAAARPLIDGNAGEATTLLLWSAGLSGSIAERERRTLYAVAILMWNYQTKRAESLLGAVEAAAESPLRSCILGRYAMTRGWFSAAETQLRSALAGAPDAPDAALIRMLAGTGLAALYFWQGNGDATIDAARGARDTHAYPGLDRIARQLEATARIHTAGARAAIADLDRLLSLPASANSAVAHQADGLAWRGSLRGLLGEFPAAVGDAHAVVRFIQEGRVSDVDVSPAYSLAWASYMTGRWDEAAINAEHALSVAIAEGKGWAYAQAHMIMTLVLAGRGDFKGAETSAAEADRWVHTLGPDQYMIFPVLAGAAIAQARADHATMAKVVAPLVRFAQPRGWPLAYEPWWRILQAEALIGVGDVLAAAEAVRRVRAYVPDMPVLECAAVRLEGQLAEAEGDEREARRIFDEGLSATTGAPDIPLHRAMLEEAYGRLLVRLHERRAGIGWLKSARQRFLALGAVPFAERCAQGFATITTQQPGDASGPLAVLTERERSVAGLVARGLTSQEVATRLFLSTKTVGYHLGHIYEKLEVASRRELRDLLASTDLGLPENEDGG